MVLHRYAEQVMTMCRVQNESSRLNTFWVISPSMVFCAYSCPLCNLNTLWNIIMILHNYVEQVMMICRVQKGQPSHSYFLSRFHTFWAIFLWLFQLQSRVCSITLIPLGIIMILRSNVGPVLNDNSHFHTFWFISPWWFQMQIPCLLQNLNALWYIIIVLYSYDKQVLTMGPEKERQPSLYTFWVVFPWWLKLQCPLFLYR